MRRHGDEEDERRRDPPGPVGVGLVPQHAEERLAVAEEERGAHAPEDLVRVDVEERAVVGDGQAGAHAPGPGAGALGAELARALERLLGEQAVDVVGLDVAALREHGSESGAAGVRGERSGGGAATLARGQWRRRPLLRPADAMTRKNLGWCSAR